MPAFVLCNDGTAPGLRLEEFSTLDEANNWINDQLIVVEGVGQRTRKMYRIIVGEEIALTEPTA
jgi:site-specific recombinase XerC